MERRDTVIAKAPDSADGREERAARTGQLEKELEELEKRRLAELEELQWESARKAAALMHRNEVAPDHPRQAPAPSEPDLSEPDLSGPGGPEQVFGRPAVQGPHAAGPGGSEADLQNPDLQEPDLQEPELPDAGPGSAAQPAAEGDVRTAAKSKGKKSGNRTKSRAQIVREWLIDITCAVGIAVIIMQFIKPTIVKQHSMEPGFCTNDYLFVSRQSYRLFGGKPELGDVIVFESNMKTEAGADKMLIKRVIGVPGDVIRITGGKVYVNNEVIDDSYTNPDANGEHYTSGEIEDLVVPGDCLFVLGDNRSVSIDSRYPSVGLVPYDAVIGKVVFRLLPFSKAGRIENPYK